LVTLGPAVWDGDMTARYSGNMLIPTCFKKCRRSRSNRFGTGRGSEKFEDVGSPPLGIWVWLTH